jgi:hypothetical protein
VIIHWPILTLSLPGEYILHFKSASSELASHFMSGVVQMSVKDLMQAEVNKTHHFHNSKLLSDMAMILLHIMTLQSAD